MGDHAALLPVILGRFELREVLGCQRLVSEGRLVEGSGDGVRRLLAKVLHEPQGSMDLGFRQVLHKGVQSLLLRHAVILHSASAWAFLLRAADGSTRVESDRHRFGLFPRAAWREAHLTVLRLGSTDELLVWALLTGTANPFSSLAENPRLSRLSWLPSLLVPEKLNVPALREAAARFQADLLFLNRTLCQQFTSYRLFGADTCKTYCVAEGLLLDVRTGVIPFSTATAREVKVRQSEDDLHFYETMQRAESETSAEALADLAAQLSSFLAAAP